MNKLNVLYHGSTKVIHKPSMALAKKTNDYGPGFYTCEDIELAKEWACQKNQNGILNEYLFDSSNLKILNLLDQKCNILHWITLLLMNRNFNTKSELTSSVKQYLIKHYQIDLKPYDVVIGYRADDRYFKFAQDFIENSISIENLEKAFRLGDLGVQVVLISEKAFNHLHLVNNEIVDSNIYHSKFIHRDESARNAYQNIKANVVQGTYILDIIRKGAKS